MIGFINLYKPEGMSSAQAVARVKRALSLEKSCKVGHAGTLDPMACGILPIAVGKATKLFDFMLTKTKTYLAEFTFGYETDTLDREGECVKKSEIIPTKAEILKVLPHFIGCIEQIPPKYSAKSVGGVRAYDLARSGREVELKSCRVEVLEFDLVEDCGGGKFKFKIVCGSGTYIRSLCRDIAYSLGSVATMTALERVEVGVFNIENSVKLDEVSSLMLLPCEIVLQKLPILNITDEQELRLFQGKRVEIDGEDGEYRAYNCGLMGLCCVENRVLKMKIWLK